MSLAGLMRKRQEGKLLKHLRAKGFSPKDLSENEVAKLHGQHMVGGEHLHL